MDGVNEKTTLGFVPLSRNFTDGEYHDGFFNKTVFLRYLQLIERMDKHAESFAGHNNFDDELYKISKRAFKEATNFLIDNHFIELSRKSNTRYYYRVKIPPIQNKKKILPVNQNHCMRVEDLLEVGHGFIRLPHNFLIFLNTKLDIENDITLKELLLLLKLYELTFMEVYGGVCHTVIRRDYKNHVFMGNSVFEDVYMTEDEVKLTLRKFEKFGLFKWVKVVIYKEDINGIPQEQYLKDYDGVPVGKNQWTRFIIRLTYLPPPMQKWSC